MVKFERKNTEKAKLAIRSLKKAKEANATYNTDEVNLALEEMFHNKCYICENDELGSRQIEHFRSHKGNVALKYDWNNLFWSCGHCNNIKSCKFDDILDCTVENVDKFIAFRQIGYLGHEMFVFEAQDERLETKKTIDLLKQVYYGTTTQKEIEARMLRKSLRHELEKFESLVRDYHEEYNAVKKEDLKFSIQNHLKNSSAFTAFKRWCIRDSGDIFPEFIEYIRQMEQNGSTKEKIE